ncbi:hypothetical protein UR09_02725 [Candidatus Nitromaritima sp. SCGC AAA799-A02]|nr:hypothetical protein UR09_02725 [Candidatus Nitromaritima sp. SCGC AAA799-A02]
MRKASDDEDKKSWAHHYLIELLGKSRGLPTKIGQFMTMNEGDAELRETLDDSIPAMPFDEVKEVIGRAYGASWDTIFSSLDEEGNSASLGQVHFGKLRTGRHVAVKVQYPEIGRAVESELDLMGWMPKVGPVEKWGFNMEGYRDAFWSSFSQELDYLTEMKHQKKYYELAMKLPNLVVPEVDTDLCRSTVLVQAREEGFSLDKAVRMGLPQRQAMGRALLTHYVFMLFRHGYVHSDPNPNNFAFRQEGKDRFSLILYDYGSVLEISESVRQGLLRVILALRYKEPVDPVACLAVIGFDVEKLEDLRPTLPALLSVLFEPFIVEGPYDSKEWKMSERFDQIVGELKWWFRSAAPPELIFLMRTIHGLVVQLERLDVKLPWQFLMDRECSDLYPSAQSLELPEIPSTATTSLRFDGMARYLKIYVIKANGNKISLTMPARVADGIREVIDPPVLESIEKQKIDLDAIQDRVRKSGFIPQTMFQVKDSERDVRVWLE